MAITRIPKFAYIATAAISSISLSIGLTGCAPESTPVASTGDTKTVTLVAHDSFAMSKELIAAFETETNYKLEIIKSGDAGAMTNKLVLTKDRPLGDVVFGVDNTYASVAKSNGVIEGELTAIDFGDVCLNYDKTWFATNETKPPTSLADLTKPEFKGLTVLTNPASSSPGLAFLAASVATFGDAGYGQFLQGLKNNDVKIDAGWEDAYFTDFSGSSGKGAYPIVLSYSTSPAFEVREDGQSQTASVLEGCFRQTEYAGVLKGTDNPAGAKALIDFMLADQFQTALPDAMYVYPINKKIALPEAWTEWAPVADKPVGSDLDIAANREKWLKTWSEIF
jgi:thiamine transport system substrate-binding protein